MSVIVRLLCVAAFLALSLFQERVDASSHADAPLITKDPTADNTDVYAFVGPDNSNKVTLIANYIPMEEPSSGPNYYSFDSFIDYNIHIDNNGDGEADITYTFVPIRLALDGNTYRYNFGPIAGPYDSNQNVIETGFVKKTVAGSDPEFVASSVPVAPANIGPDSNPTYDLPFTFQFIYDMGAEGRIFVGPRDDAFFIDWGAIHDLIELRTPGGAGAGLARSSGSVEARDGLAGFNVHSIAFEIPIENLTEDGSIPGDPADPKAIIGVWATVVRPETRHVLPDGFRFYDGAPRQVARMDLPMVSLTLIPLGLKNLFNVSAPELDAQFESAILDPPFAEALSAALGIPAAPAPRTDIRDYLYLGLPGLTRRDGAFPCMMLRLNLAIPPTPPQNQHRLGVLGGDPAGFPNGRRPIDDVTDVLLTLILGDPNITVGDGVDANDKPFLSEFPYLAAPHQGFDHTHEPVAP